MEPLVSVIVPVYNVRPFLREALDSLVGQTYRNLEILVIDDGSTDGSAAVCDEYGDKDPRIVVIHQENRGLSGARNTGLDRMTGQIVAFLDPDDAFCPDMIRTMVEAMEQENADMAICGFSAFCTEERMDGKRAQFSFTIRRRAVLDRQEALATLIKGEINTTVWEKVYRRRIWETLRFPEGHVYEDIRTLYLATDCAERIVTIPSHLVRYRKREGSITKTDSPENIQDWILARDYVDQFVHDRIPELFTVQQEALLRERHLRAMISFWTKVPPSDRAFAEELRQAVLDYGGTLDTRAQKARTRIAYDIVRFCPQLMPAVLPVYRFFRMKIVRPIIGR